MLATDQTLVQLATSSTRGQLLTSDALLAIASTGYDFDPTAVVGDVTATFDTFDVGVSIGATVTGTARWGLPTDPVQHEGSAVLAGLLPPVSGADAVWSGTVLLHVATGLGTITAADVTEQPATVDGRPVDIGLEFSAPPAVAPADPPFALPAVVGFLVADASASVLDLLQRTESARRATARYVASAPPAGAPARLHDRLVCWLVPGAAFDDDGWPGGDAGTTAARRAARLALAQTWLTTQGISVVLT